MIIPFKVFYPSGNNTALIDGLGYSAQERHKLNNAIQKIDPKIEQVGFVSVLDGIIKLEMAGGEFCGNACRSAVFWKSKGRKQGLICSSGTEKTLAWTVTANEIKVEMPVDQSTNVVEVEEGFLVNLDGITQLVSLQDCNPRDLLTAIIQEERYDVLSTPAFGISIYNLETNQANFCVWVNSINTMFDETACGSGTAAIGLVNAKAGNTLSKIIQPSGEVITSELSDKRLYISGSVTKLYDSEITI